MGKRKHAAIKGVKSLSTGFLKVSLYDFEVEAHAGGIRTSSWEVMERGHAVGVLGYDPRRDEVVLVNEFRPGALVAGDYPFTDNLVAGVIEADESPLVAAAREMKEEAGLDLHDPILIHPGAYVSSGGCSEKIAIVAGTVDTTNAGGIHGNEHEREDILAVILPAQEFIDRTRRAQITDMKTMIAGYWLAENRQSLKR
jgi:ADP-ribose pyrophosphatase